MNEKLIDLFKKENDLKKALSEVGKSVKEALQREMKATIPAGMILKQMLVDSSSSGNWYNVAVPVTWTGEPSGRKEYDYHFEKEKLVLNIPNEAFVWNEDKFSYPRNPRWVSVGEFFGDYEDFVPVVSKQ